MHSDLAADRACEKRMTELAERAGKTGVTQFSRFLTPAELEEARICARKAGVFLFCFGGFDEAERRVAAFAAENEPPAEWPVGCLRVSWARRFASPGHRDILGALMSLGMDRSHTGDIVVAEGEAHVFALPAACKRIAGELLEAGGATLDVEVIDGAPLLSAPEGEPLRGTVSSLRLDALLDLAFRLSRGRATDLVKAGRVQVDHLPELRPDRKVAEGAVISVRGMGRAVLEEVGGQTKKDRTSVTLLRYGL